MQLVPLKQLEPQETSELTLDLLKHTHISDPNDKKYRGTIVLELTFTPFREESTKTLSGKFDLQKSMNRPSSYENLDGAGLLTVLVQGAEDVEGERHNNPYALVIFRGEQRKTKVIYCMFNFLITVFSSLKIWIKNIVFKLPIGLRVMHAVLEMLCDFTF